MCVKLKSKGSKSDLPPFDACYTFTVHSLLFYENSFSDYADMLGHLAYSFMTPFHPFARKFSRSLASQDQEDPREMLQCCFVYFGFRLLQCLVCCPHRVNVPDFSVRFYIFFIHRFTFWLGWGVHCRWSEVLCKVSYETRQIHSQKPVPLFLVCFTKVNNSFMFWRALHKLFVQHEINGFSYSKHSQ